MQHWFAPVIGHDSTAVSATATVALGRSRAPGTAVLPLTFSWCEFDAQTGGGLPSGDTSRTIRFTKTSATGCTGPSHNVVPGGFAYLDTDRAVRATAPRDRPVGIARTGNSVPSPLLAEPTSRAWLGPGTSCCCPCSTRPAARGSNAWYHVYGYAAFKLTGYSLGGQYSTSPQPCSGNERCVAGYFTASSTSPTLRPTARPAPTLGASILRLIR